MAGNYRFGKHRAGRYLLSVRTIGYKTLYDTVLLRKPSIGMTEVVRDYVLSEDVAEIDAVVVTANNTASYFDRTVYTITNEDRKAAVTSLDLTNKIPQIRINRQTNQITASDGSVTVLVNGIASSEQELTTLRPEDVRKIEYYDLPPIKFGLSNGNKVINIITKIREDGIYGSVELQCHVFVEGRRKTLMSRCSNSSPRYSVRTTMPSLLILKISYVFNNKISITLLSFLICLGRSFPNPNTKVMKSCDNHLCCNRFICSLFKIGILQFHPSAFPLRLYRSVYALP